MYEPGTPAFENIQQVMATGNAMGHNRPVARVSYMKRRIRRHRSNRPGPWRNLLFPAGLYIPPGSGQTDELGGHDGQRAGLPHVHTMTINRSIDSDAATCTIVFINDYMRRDYYAPEGNDTGIGRPGYFTVGRGEEATLSGDSVYRDLGPTERFSTDWDYPKNHAHRILQPNTILFTYQGYGSDNFNEFGQERYIHQESYIPPHEDSKLLPTGTWLIDRVNFSTDGFITVECRDMGKLLLEQFVYPPMIPMERFPLTYCPVTVERSTAPGSPEPARTTLSGSSNDPYVGWNGSVYGHRPSHAFDGSNDTYWLSVGNSGPRFDFSFEWVQGRTNGAEVDQIRISPIYAGMTGYISVREGGSWQGSKTVPYNPNAAPAAPNGANIPYVLRVPNMPRGMQTIDLPRTYAADDVRVCFTNLGNSGRGQFPYRAGVRRFRAQLSTVEVTETSDIGEPGVITDWSDAIKELVGWAGLTWHDSLEPEDLLLGRTTSDNKPLRAWGDFENLGAGPIECTPADFFLNKSFMECVTQIKDFLGCVFFIDHHGGAIFRHPNIFSGGNFITDPFGEPLGNMYSVLHDEGIYLQEDSSGDITRGQLATVLVRMLEWLGYTLPPTGADHFSDIDGNVHREAINRLAEAGIAWGFPDGTYQPERDSSRGQSATLVVRSAEWATSSTLPLPETSPFTDIAGHNHETNINKAYEAGLMFGYQNDTFRPDEALSRYASAVVMYRMGDHLGHEMPPVITQRLGPINGQISTVYSPYIEAWPIELHENSNLLDYTVTIDDSQLRSEILVVGESPDIESDMPAGGIDLVAPGGDGAINFREILRGQTRMFQVPGDATKLFRTEIECQRMAEMTALFILFTYRRGSATALAHPGLQLDDQIRIYERITNERNVHYVSAITTNFDADSGEYTMDLTTHWLGKDPNTEWFLDELVLTDGIRNLPRIEARLAEAEKI